MAGPMGVEGNNPAQQERNVLAARIMAFSEAGAEIARSIPKVLDLITDPKERGAVMDSLFDLAKQIVMKK